MSFENSAAIESIFGRWPSFHDAEVLRVVLDRSGDKGPTLEAAIHVFEMTSDVDPKDAESDGDIRVVDESGEDYLFSGALMSWPPGEREPDSGAVTGIGVNERRSMRAGIRTSDT